MTKILQVSTVKPKYKYHTAQIIEVADHLWLSKKDAKDRKMALKIFHGAEIDTRYSVAPLEEVFSKTSFEEKNNIYIKESIQLGVDVLKKALDASGLQPTDIDVIITTSCTGFMIPSVDAYMINQLKMRQDVHRLPVTEMGCAGGTSALIYANQYIKANPKLKVAIVSVEAPSLTFQHDDMSMENLVSTAIFADGAACVILSGDSSDLAPEIVDTSMYNFPDTTYLMGYHLQNSGLKIVLDRDIPDTIDSHFQNIFYPFLDKNKVNPKDIHHYMFHPGGKKIINSVDNFISQFGKDISISKNILKEHGNMSSATILHILEKFMTENKNKDDLGYMLAFGPGFMAQSLLLKWS
ncbi:MAG: hypothetical protein KDD37_00775 [Bdellovibrionales bacterium]|nr:hypothetical protein [Bdellovibrionales bacterium]